MKFENTRVFNFDGALRGMRNPKNSWNLSDSDFSDECSNGFFEGKCADCKYFDGYDKPCIPRIGPRDLRLAQQLIRAGSEHRKFMRQIIVCVDITASIFYWKEFDTYKVGTVANSTSTMHKLDSAPITLGCFETDDYAPDLPLTGLHTVSEFSEALIECLEGLRRKYHETKDKRYWKELVRWLPCGWLQKRTVTMSYENLLAMCSKGQRRFHKLTEWSQSFISWARTLPYAQELIFLDELDDDAAELKKSSDKLADAMKLVEHLENAVADSTDGTVSLEDVAKKLVDLGWQSPSTT